MEKVKYITLRVTKKQKEVYKEISYFKSEVIKAFLDKYSSKLDEFIEAFKAIEELPISMVEGGRHTIIAPKGIKNKRDLKAFFGYITLLLVEEKGDVESVARKIKEEFNVHNL